MQMLEHGSEQRRTLLFFPCTAIAYWYGEDEEKDRRGNLRFNRRYFPQAQLAAIPKMAHAELVIVHPEEFCRYAGKYLAGQTDAEEIRQ